MSNTVTYAITHERLQELLRELYDKYRYIPEEVCLNPTSYANLEKAGVIDAYKAYRHYFSEVTGEKIVVNQYLDNWRAYDHFSPGHLLLDPRQLPGPCVRFGA